MTEPTVTETKIAEKSIFVIVTRRLSPRNLHTSSKLPDDAIFNVTEPNGDENRYIVTGVYAPFFRTGLDEINVCSKSFFPRPALCVLAFGVTLTTGCGETGEVKVPEAKVPSLSDAIGGVKTMITNISDAMAENNVDKAHGPLHEIGHKLEALPKMIDASSLADEAKTAAKSAIDSLMSDFGKVDAKLHGA